MLKARLAATRSSAREHLFTWEGRDKTGKIVRGEMRASGNTVVLATLRRQGILVTRVKQRRLTRGSRIRERDLVLFTRQLATMMKSGVPLLQAFDIGIKSSANPALARLLNDIRGEVETGTRLSQAFARHPQQFDRLFCNLIAAGEHAGILDDLLERIASAQEKILVIKAKIRSALLYPTVVTVVAALVIAVMMMLVIPRFKDMFASSGADLPMPTQVVIALSDFVVSYWYLIAAAVAAAVVGGSWAYRRSDAAQALLDRIGLELPVIGTIIRKAVVARWSRTLSTMLGAGVPLVEALDSVGGAAGNQLYLAATRAIQNEVSTGTRLTVAMQDSAVFPVMAVQMVSIGEESGQLDTMLGKIADFLEQEIDSEVSGLSQLLEPVIMVVLGVLIGGLVVAMYLPIFRIGAAV